MAKKSKAAAVLLRWPEQIKNRIDTALEEGRFQYALELCKQLYNQETTPENRELLLKVYLGRAQQLREQGKTRDAAAVLENIIRVAGDDPAWMEPVATELAHCGEAKRAILIMSQQPNSALQSQVLSQAVDSAFEKGASARQSLPDDALRQQFDTIKRAFGQLQAGQDDAVRETLQGIGLQSPFLDWKLLIRGLQAYYQEDDIRAIENWSRLKADRLPARLAAPFRFRIDVSFKKAQIAQTQALLAKQAEKLHGGGVAPQLRSIQGSLAQGELGEAFSKAEKVVPILQQQCPHVVGRLASCFYWAIVHRGEATDVSRYRRLFGAPADDPELYRLEALATEEHDILDEAHSFWRKYENWVASHPEAFPPGQADRVRALIWCRMGRNAASLPNRKEMRRMPDFLRRMPGRPKPLNPPAEKCFERSLKLAPDQLEAHQAVFEHFLQEKKNSQALAAGRRLLEHFPEHVQTLEALGELCLELEDYPEALNLYQRALQVNPLDRDLRQCVGHAHLVCARSHAEQGCFEEARNHYRAVQAFDDGKLTASLACKWAACEFKAGDTNRAEELLQHAWAEGEPALGTSFMMLVEAIRLKLASPLKKRFEKGFTDALAMTPTVPAITSALDALAVHVAQNVKYHGQQSHQKKLLAYLQKIPLPEFDESQLERVCRDLLILKDLRLLRKLTAHGRRRFASSPHFCLLEAESHLAAGPERCRFDKVGYLLELAEDRLESVPEDQKRLLQERIGAIRELTAANDMMRSPFGMMDMFQQAFGQMFGGGGDEEDYDDGYEDEPPRRRRR